MSSSRFLMKLATGPSPPSPGTRVGITGIVNGDPSWFTGMCGTSISILPVLSYLRTVFCPRYRNP